MALVVGEASSSSTPSTSIPPPRSWTYHVFLSFRGEDTRRGFTDHLYASLERKGIKTFRDDKDLERGDVISQELLKAIEESMFAIIVLSPNYASSTWCLDELQRIVECSKNFGLSVVPVFYGVKPSDVRHQKGSFEEAFRKHGQRFRRDSEKVKRWKDALTHVANYSGWDSKDKHEATLVESIAQHIHKKLIPKLPSSMNNLVGIVSRVEEVIRQMGIGLNDVRYIGIWGMGGIGKTTIARTVYEAIQCQFEVSCFLANVREACERSGIAQIQKELVAHMNTSSGTFYNEYDGKRIIQNSLCSKKVLLVLDDVSKEGQLKNLVGEQDWFGPGSRIIITTRDIQLLKILEVCGTYKVEGLVQNEAFDLFCLKAFKRQKPAKEYLDLSKEVVKYSGGLPLALDVLGSYLYGRPVDIWHSAIEKIKRSPHAEIFDTLKISYDGLDFMEKNVFLDIACFFKGMERDYVTNILKKCGYCAEIGIAILIDRSFVTINQKNNMLEMHDLLQDMGRNIIIQESPNDPGKRSRLWSTEDIDLVLTQNKGTEKIQSIVLNDAWHFGARKYYEARWREIAFSNICQLKFLNLSDVQVLIPLNLPSSLKVLHWDFCPMKNLPLADQQDELVEIRIYRSRIVQLWHEKKSLKKLKYVDLRGSLNLMQTPDLSAVPNLETLDLASCSNLTGIHPSLIHHKSLVVLDLRWCSSLKILPGKLEMSSLKELMLDYCASLGKLPEFGECMKHLSRLSLSRTAIKKLPTSLGCLVGLEYLNLSKCTKLTYLPASLGSLVSLSDLNLSECTKLTCLPHSIRGLKSLRVLNVSYCKKVCGSLHFLSSLTFLSSLHLRWCFLAEESSPHHFGRFPSLTDLDLSYNHFVRVPISIHELPKLRRLRLNHCRNLKFLPELPSSIRELEAQGCRSLNEFEFHALSKACCLFASASQDRGEVLQMEIPGREVPSWFVHRQEGNCVSAPLPHNCPSNERMGVALCFLFRAQYPNHHFSPQPSVICSGKGFITKGASGLRPLWVAPDFHRFVLCLTSDYFSDEFGQDNRFELLFGDCFDGKVKILSSAARWVCKQDIEDLMKSESERAKGKVTFEQTEREKKSKT